MKILILILILISFNYSQLTCGDNPAYGLFNALVADVKVQIQNAIDNPIDDQLPQQEGQPTPEQLLAELNDLESALTDYDTQSAFSFSSTDSNIGHCSQLFQDGDQICCSSEIISGISKLIQAKAHQYARHRPKMFRLLERQGSQIKECAPQNSLPEEADPQQNQFQTRTRNDLFKCQLQQILAQVRFLRGLSCAICVAPEADYTNSNYFSTETVTLTVDGTSYTINKFKINETSFDQYMEMVSNGTSCLGNFSDTYVQKFSSELQNFAQSAKCTNFKTDLQTFLEDPSTVPCVGESTCHSYCQTAIQANPFRDGCALEGVEDDSTIDAFSRILQDTETMVITSDGLDAQVVNETEDSTFNLDGITLYDTSDSNSGTVILVCKLMLLFLLIQFMTIM